MRCENCPAMQNIGGYEYPEYECIVQSEDEIRTFSDGADGCLLHLKTIQERIKRDEEARAEEYERMANWYILTHEIEGEPEMLNRCIDVMKHAIGMSGSCSQRHKIYHRHGKAFYKPWRNYFATSKKNDDFPVWENLCACRLANSNMPTADGYWKDPDMVKTIYYTVTPEGLKWLQEKIEPGLRIHGAAK